MKRKILWLITVLVMSFSLLVFAGCGSTQGQDLETYMKDQVSASESINAQLNILSPDAKASVQYSGNTADVTVQYYAMTDEEIEQLEPDKAKVRCNAILEPVLEQFEADTGNKATVNIVIEGHNPER